MTAPLPSLEHAQTLERAGRFVEAERLYRDLLNARPDDADLLHSLAIVLHAQGALDEAAQVLRSALSLRPREPALFNTLGVVLNAKGEFADAEASYRRALALYKDFADAWYNLGTLLEQTQRTDEALDAYRQAVAAQPAYAQAFTRIAALLNGKAMYEQALAQVERALAAAPDFFDARYYRGWILSNLERHDEALAAFTQAAVLRPESFELALARTHALRDAGRQSEALEDYRKLIERQPERAATHHELNQLAWTWGRRDLYLRSFDYARERLGEVPELLYLEAAFRLRQDEHAAAERLLGRARMLAPQRGDIAGLLARALAGQRRFEESYPLFAAAVAGEPDVPAHRQEFGFALLRDAKAKLALQVFEQALAFDSFDQVSLAGLALAYRQLGDSRYRELMDFEKYVRCYELRAPAGFADTEAFNRALALELDARHTSTVAPIDQTLKGGTQTTGQLFAARGRAIAQVRESIEAAVADYIGALPQAPAHPMLRRKLDAFGFSGSWSCRLASGGFHDNHVHPKGWISSAYYARLPDSRAEAPRAGWLSFGASNLALDEDDRAEHAVQPRVGRLVLFPSFYWHGTVPFAGGGDRLALAFDVVPVRIAP